MIFTRSAIPDIITATPIRHRDERGYLTETWSRHVYSDQGIEIDFVQDNLVHSHKSGTVRGLHFQNPPFSQGKLVSVCCGAVYDVAVDIRENSPTFGQHVATTLSATEGNQIWVPEGFAHGYCTLEDDTLVIYKQTALYAPEHEGGILWNDPALDIDWPVHTNAAILSAKDRELPTFAHWKSTR